MHPQSAGGIVMLRKKKKKTITAYCVCMNIFVFLAFY